MKHMFTHLNMLRAFAASFTPSGMTSSLWFLLLANVSNLYIDNAV